MSTDQIKKGVQAGWDAMSESYQAETRISLDDVHYGPISPGERDLKLLGDVRGKRVLELACGAAQNAIVLAKWGARVAAMDFSAGQLRKARELVARERVRVDLVRGDMERPRMFHDGCFDVVMSSFGWEFVPDLAICLGECHRVMRRGGLLVMCMAHPLAAFEWDDDARGLLVTDYFNLPVEVWKEPSQRGRDPAVTIFRTVQEMVEMLASAGFGLERILEPYPYPLPEMSDAERRAIPYIGPYWESQYERFTRVPFTIIYTARKQ